MIPSEQYQHYAALLRIRQAAARRNSIILGVVLALGLLAAFLSNFYSEPTSGSDFLATALLIMLGLGFVSSWLRLEMFGHLLELVDFLQRESR